MTSSTVKPRGGEESVCGADPHPEPVEAGSRTLEDRAAYARAVLDAYRTTPCTTGHVRASDRRLVEELRRRGVPADNVMDAFLLATARRLARPKDAPPLGTIRSLAYFLPVIDELSQQPITAGYRAHLVNTVARLCHAQPS